MHDHQLDATHCIFLGFAEMDEDKPVSEETRKQFDNWRQKAYELYQKWMLEEGLTLAQCNERFWGKDFMERWKKL